jgi:hypothetical protein
VRKVRGTWSTVTVIALAIMFLLTSQVPDTADATGDKAIGPTSPFPATRHHIDAQDGQHGYTLISPTRTDQTFLLDEGKNALHTWNSSHLAQGPTYMLDNGTILRCMAIAGAGKGALGLELLDWDGTVLWSYRPPKPYTRHHDVEPLPNGNVLMIVRETIRKPEAVDLGRDPLWTNDTLWVDQVIEVRPNGTDGGDIVWSWDPSDHVVQDIDPGRPNYGDLSESPGLLDINLPYEDTRDWLHLNGVDYHPGLDQVMITSRNFSEFWVVDRSTTMEEAAGHTGGDHGVGGDILYRWGNPKAYGMGDGGDQVLYGPHDGHWIDPGLPGEGNVMVFNNGRNEFEARPDGRYSTVDEMVPPLNGSGGYDRSPGKAFGPSDLEWRYNASPPDEFFAGARSGAQRLPDGNTLVCDGVGGRLFEVDPAGEVVWFHVTDPAFNAARYYPPRLDSVPDQLATEDVPLSLDVSVYVSDPDTDLERLELETGSPYCTASGLRLEMLYPEGVLEDEFDLVVSDGAFRFRVPVKVRVVPVNDPPVLATLPHLEVVEDVPASFDLAPYLDDTDDPVMELEVTTGSPYVTVEGTVLEATYPEGVLEDDIDVQISDGELGCQGLLHVVVSPVNDPPVVSEMPDLTVVEDMTTTLDLSPYVSDVDTAWDRLSLSTSSRFGVVQGTDLALTYPDGVPSERVVVTVSDGEFQVSTGFDVTIQPVNDPPTIALLPPVTVEEDMTLRLDLGPYIGDIDTAHGDLALEVDSPNVVVEGHALLLTYPDGVLGERVVVAVSDGELTTTSSLDVTVRPVNDPPAWRGELDIEATEDEPGLLDLGPHIQDPDTPPWELAVTCGSPYVTVDGLVLSFLYPEGVLADDIVLSVTDGEYTARLSTTVQVTAVNDDPALSGGGVTPGSGDEATVYSFRVVAEDPDTGLAALTVTLEVDGMMLVMSLGPSSGEGAIFVLETTLGAGEHTFSFSADDGAGGTATTGSFEVTVAEGPIDDPGTTTGGETVAYIVLVAVLVVGGVALALLSRRTGAR